MVFGGTAARSSAIGTANFEEGMLTYLTDVDKLQVYTGATFADVYPAAASTQGLTLINTTSFSGVTTQAFTSIFTATYENYLIDVTITSVANQDLALRLRSSTTDSSTNYDYGLAGFGANAVARTASGANATKLLMCRGNTGTAANRIGWQTVIQKPNLAQPTTFLTVATGTDGSGMFSWSGGGTHFAANAYDGFNLIFEGNCTGTISIYAFNK
jgi:hypothetical protein